HRCLRVRRILRLFILSPSTLTSSLIVSFFPYTTLFRSRKSVCTRYVSVSLRNRSPRRPSARVYGNRYSFTHEADARLRSASSDGRSEERRVGKECGVGGAVNHDEENKKDSVGKMLLLRVHCRQLRRDAGE